MESNQPLTCFRCATHVPAAVYGDTGGLCRSCQKSVPKRVELADLVACMQGRDKRYRGVYFDNYCKRKPSVEALTVLRQALLLGDSYLAKCAAVAIGKLKEKAKEAIPELLVAAKHLDECGMPQAYGECLTALVAIDKTNPAIFSLIRQFIHLDNWCPISASLEALAQIGSTESIKTMEEIRARWYPEFNKTQKRCVDTLLEDAKAKMRNEV